jgi:hypothetical protein
MKTFVRGQITVKGLLEALDEIGVQQGQPFVVCHPDALGSPSDINKLPPFARESATSRRAASDNYPRAGSQKDQIMQALFAASGGLTTDELERLLDLPHQSCSARVYELVNDEWAYRTGKERRTRAGSDAEVIAASEKAEAQREAESIMDGAS